MYTLPQLPYGYDALAPHIDAQTMEIHHTKHHQTYVDKLNAALEAQPDLANQSVEELLRAFNAVPAELQKAVRNHGGGHANHSLFWTILAAQPGEASEGVTQAITTLCGSMETFKEHFTKAATDQFGSGWAWLVVNVDKSLEIIATSNQDSPLIEGRTPIMGLDVWEHAYYLNYQNRRPEYVAAFWNVLNWSEVSRRYEEAVK
ncbi:MAG: superoxide dismutase [bacterium]|nr:superoxide dismutase [bacterium]